MSTRGNDNMVIKDSTIDNVMFKNIVNSLTKVIKMENGSTVMRPSTDGTDSSIINNVTSNSSTAPTRVDTDQVAVPNLLNQVIPDQSQNIKPDISSSMQQNLVNLQPSLYNISNTLPPLELGYAPLSMTRIDNAASHTPTNETGSTSQFDLASQLLSVSQLTDIVSSAVAPILTNEVNEANITTPNLESEDISSTKADKLKIQGRLRRLSETPEQRAARLKKDRVRTAKYREAFTEEQKRTIKEKQRITQQQKRMMETAEERRVRLEKSAERQRMKRQKLSEDEKLKVKEMNRMRTRERRANESEEQKELRRIRDRIRMREKRTLLKQINDLGPDLIAKSCVQVLDNNVLQPQMNLMFSSDDSDATNQLESINGPILSQLTELPKIKLQTSLFETPNLHSSDISISNHLALPLPSQCLPTQKLEQSPLFGITKQFLSEQQQKYLREKEKQRLRRRRQLQNETPEQREKRLQKSAERQRLKRQNLTEEEKEAVKEVNKIRAQLRRAEETTGAREDRRKRERVRRREQRASYGLSQLHFSSNLNLAGTGSPGPAFSTNNDVLDSELSSNSSSVSGTDFTSVSLSDQEHVNNVSGSFDEDYSRIHHGQNSNIQNLLNTDNYPMNINNACQIQSDSNITSLPNDTNMNTITQIVNNNIINFSNDSTCS